MRRTDRRRFLLAAGACLIGGRALAGQEGTAASSGDQATARTTGRKSRVVVVRNPDVLDKDGKPRQEVLGKMLAAGLTALCGIDDEPAAWASLFRPGDTVGIKSNVWKYLPTPPELERALWLKLSALGLKDENVAIDDRGVLQNQVFRRASALINVRPLRTHYWSGVGSLIKNYIMFVPEPWTYHPEACAALGAIWNLHRLGERTRLNILVMLTPQFHSVGPHEFNPRYLWNYYGLLLGFDPVAVDTVGLDILLKKRALFFQESRPLSTSARHIELASSRYRLGQADRERIETILLGEETDALL